MWDISKMTTNIIETFDLTKIYSLKGKNKTVTALNKVNIKIKEGEFFGLLGPNGAGKTTFIQILTTLLQPTSGYALVDGHNILKKPKQVKAKLGLMLESEMLYYRITAYDNLKFFCKIYRIPNYKEKIYDILETFGLKEWLNQYVENFSSGMKMKLALCRTLLLNPKILILDEPTVGMDVKTISFIIQQLKKVKKTIILTSHDMSLVEKLCDRIAFINKGEILRIGTKEEISEFMIQEISIEIEIMKQKTQLKNELNKQDFIKEIINGNKGLLVILKNRDNYKDLLLILSKYQILKVKEKDLSLEDLFIRLM